MLAWLLPVTQKFPKEQRFALTARLQSAAFDFYEAITAASISKEKKYLQEADVELQRLRLYLRLCQRMQFFNKGLKTSEVFETSEVCGRKCQPRPVAEGIPFLGFVVFPEHRLLKRRKGIAFQRKYRKLRKDHLRGEISLERINASIQGWVNHVRYANTWRLRLSILAH
ncbi:MAG: hypothetical protein DCC59_01695 [Chloroflexi bacterium]|nr:MAG: hypothetical protein DCC59_01695 [Chloroflexota bacterium]